MKKYYVESDHNVYVDVFEDGEGDYQHSYLMDSFIKAENAKDAIEKYFSDYLYYKIDLKSVDKNDHFLNYNVLTDEDNCEASKKEIADWKNKKIKLYNNNITLVMSELKQINVEKWR